MVRCEKPSTMECIIKSCLRYKHVLIESLSGMAVTENFSRSSFFLHPSAFQVRSSISSICIHFITRECHLQNWHYFWLLIDFYFMNRNISVWVSWEKNKKKSPCTAWLWIIEVFISCSITTTHRSPYQNHWLIICVQTCKMIVKFFCYTRFSMFMLTFSHLYDKSMRIIVQVVKRLSF